MRSRTDPWNRKVLRSRLLSRRRVDSKTGCWLYTGHLHKSTRTGKPTYGRMRVGDRLVYVHKVAAWVFLKNKAAVSRSRKVNVCHTCDNPPCFRPKHLVVATPKWNTEDAVAKGIHFMSSKTRCKYGHVLSGNNLSNDRRQRRCKTCNRRRARDAYWRKKCSI